MAYRKCTNCGSEEFAADVIYSTSIIFAEDGDWEQTGDSEARELDKNSVQCLNCGGALDPELHT